MFNGSEDLTKFYLLGGLSKAILGPGMAFQSKERNSRVGERESPGSRVFHGEELD